MERRVSKAFQTRAAASGSSWTTLLDLLLTPKVPTLLKALMEKTDKVILLVEDNEDDVFLMKRAFKAAGIQNPVHVVNDGEAVIRYLSGEGQFAEREKFPFPSVMFLDLKLPYLSGLEVLKWKLEHPEIPPITIIVVTSSNEPTDLKTAYRLGASSYIVKPPTADQLLEIVKAFRLYWLTCNSFPENRPL